MFLIPFLWGLTFGGVVIPLSRYARFCGIWRGLLWLWSPTHPIGIQGAARTGTEPHFRFAAATPDTVRSDRFNRGQHGAFPL